MFTNMMEWENTPSDNSHLFDYPLEVKVETVADLDISLPRSQCMKYIEEGKFIPFEMAGIEVHCHFTDKKKKG